MARNGEDWVLRLAAEDEGERALAVEELGEQLPPGAVELLVERLCSDSSYFVREVALNTLKFLRGEEVIEKTVPLLSSREAMVRNAAIEILSEQGEAALPWMESLLAAADKDLRKFALDILFRLDTDKKLPLLARGLDDPDANNRITAVEYLGRLEAYAFAPRINQLFCSESHPFLRCVCLETLAAIGNEESTQLVNRFYNSGAALTDLETFSYLKFVARRGNAGSLPLIISLMKQKGNMMAKEIINALTGILERWEGDLLPAELLSAVSDFLRGNLNDINSYELLILLSRFKNAEVFGLLARYLSLNNKLLCLGAVEGLGRHGNREALLLLLSLKAQAEEKAVAPGGEEYEELLEALEEAIHILQG